MLTLLWWRWKTFMRRMRLGFRRGDIVLDVGSGHRPHPRSDLLCDRYLTDDSQRGGGLVKDRPVVCGDLTALPLKDHSVDFVICQHVLEHVEDVEGALQELMRVARGGYIETPSPLWEKLVGRSYHLWLIERRGTQLVCVPKPTQVPYRDLLPRFETFARLTRGWPLLTLERFDDFYTSLRWEGTIDYRIVGRVPASSGHEERWGGEDGGPHVEAPPPAPPGILLRLKPWLWRAARWAIAPRRSLDLDALLACPGCHGDLRRERATLQCARCRLLYPVRDGIPILLREEARPLHRVDADADRPRPAVASGVS